MIETTGPRPCDVPGGGESHDVVARRPPAYGVATLNRMPAYRIDLRTCRRARRLRQIADHSGALDSLAALACKTGISRSTQSRFWNGQHVSVEMARRIVRVLGLRFEDVAVLWTEET